MKIAEVSQRYGLSADTLRYYERVGLLPPVNRIRASDGHCRGAGNNTSAGASRRGRVAVAC